MNPIKLKKRCDNNSCKAIETDDGDFFKCCKSCRVTNYCSRSCQKEDWKIGHKLTCNSTKAEGVDRFTNSQMKILKHIPRWIALNNGGFCAIARLSLLDKYDTKDYFTTINIKYIGGPLMFQIIDYVVTKQKTGEKITIHDADPSECLSYMVQLDSLDYRVTKSLKIRPLDYEIVRENGGFDDETLDMLIKNFIKTINSGGNSYRDKQERFSEFKENCISSNPDIFS
jgi:hypothetical protein